VARNQCAMMILKGPALRAEDRIARRLGVVATKQGGFSLRVAKLRFQNFRGFDREDFAFDGDTVLAGEPRAGRSDVVSGMRRVLDPRSTRSRVNPLDIHRGEGTDPSELTEVEVTLLNLGAELEVLFGDYLELFSPDTGDIASAQTAGDAVVGLRICYRARYDSDSDTGEHWVDAVASSDPASGTFKRLSRIERESLPVLFVDSTPPLQVRSEGAFRQFAGSQDLIGLDAALEALEAGVSEATGTFSKAAPIAAAIELVLKAGAKDLLGAEGAASVGFAAEDGSLGALLRALQPTLDIDTAGMLPLTSHGSSAQATFAASEAVASATLQTGDLVIIADDFGDSIDGPSAEHLALLIRKAASQFIATTRRPEVVRAFQVEHLIRLTISHGKRQHHRLSSANKTGRTTRRLVIDQLISAVTSRTIVLLEGPLDAEGYGALASRLAAKYGNKKYSLAANGIRLVAPPGSDGGISRLPAIATLVSELGFHTRALVDSDKPGDSAAIIAEINSKVEQLVVLPERTAVEAALIRGVPGDKLRESVDALLEVGMPPLPEGMDDADIADHLVTSKALKKQGLHVAWVYALTNQPPIACRAIAALCGDELGQVDVEGEPA
jgi:putative ATP-dependent endonuclease of OLD family